MSNVHDIEIAGPLRGWPAPPSDGPYHEPSQRPGATGCSIDMVEGQRTRAFALDVNPSAKAWQVAARADGGFVTLPLARVARVTLSAPLLAMNGSFDQGLGRTPLGESKRDYTVRTAAGRDLLRGRTAGHVETEDGVFLFITEPGAGRWCASTKASSVRSSAASGWSRTLQRAFVPRAANLNCEFAPADAERFSTQWIADAVSLRSALSSHAGRRMPLIGEALAQLGFVDAKSLASVLAQPAQRGRLGERMVEQGLITREQLETTLAFKLGYPRVDLARFPIDRRCACMLSPDLSKRHGAVPIMLDGRRIIVAMSGPATAAVVDALNLRPAQIIMPVFAPRAAILMAISSLREDDDWSQEVPWR